MNEHAKRGHNVSKYGDSGELIKTAQRTLQEIINETVQFLAICEKLATDSLICVDNLFKVCFKCSLIKCHVFLFFCNCRIYVKKHREV